MSAVTLPVRTEKRLPQPRQRYGIEGWAAPDCTLEPRQWGHAGPSGQRMEANHFSADSSSGNMAITSINVMPLRNHFPGPYFFIYGIPYWNYSTKKHHIISTEIRKKYEIL